MRRLLAVALLAVAVGCADEPPRNTVSQASVSFGEAAAADCGAEAERLGMIVGTAETATAMLETALLRGDTESAQAQYDTVRWAMTGLDDDASQWASSCRHHLGSSVQQTRDLVRRLDMQWRELRSACRSDLAQLGFDC